jgi:hypothetical protein
MSVKYSVLLSFSFFIGSLMSPELQLSAASANLNPSGDAFVTTGPSNNLNTNNYGAGGSLSVSAAGLAKGEFQSVLRFDASTAKSSFDSLFGAGAWTLQSVTLQLTAANVNNAIFNTNSAGMFSSSWLQNDSWVEGSGNPNTPASTGITFDTLQSNFITPGADEALGTFSYGGASSDASVYTLTMSPGFTADLLAGNPVSIRLSAADSSVSYLFNSREFGTAANRPVLSISAIPEPRTAALFVLGVLTVVLSRRTRDRRDGFVR